MIFEYNTLDQDTKLFIDPVKTLGDLGCELTQADLDKVEAEEKEETEDGKDAE